MLNTDWTEVEVIELLVDSAASLGFGMCGSKSTGIVVRQIHPGGAAEMDGRLRIGDHIVCVQDFNVRGFGPDQVATVLRHTISVSLFATGSSDRGTTSVMHTDHDLGNDGGFQPNELNSEDSMAVESALQSVAVRFIVARPALGNPDELNEIYVEQQNRFNEIQMPATLGIVPTERLDDYLETLLHSAVPFMALEPDPSVEQNVDPFTERQADVQQTADTKFVPLVPNDMSIKTTYFGANFERFLCSVSSGENETNDDEGPTSSVLDKNVTVVSVGSAPEENGSHTSLDQEEQVPSVITNDCQNDLVSVEINDENESTHANFTTESGELEQEIHVVELRRSKNEGLGLTIVGYVYKNPSSSLSDEMNYECGVFVQRLTPNSVADRCGKIQVNDQIIQVCLRSSSSDMDNRYFLAFAMDAEEQMSAVVAECGSQFLRLSFVRPAMTCAVDCFTTATCLPCVSEDS
ncbi:hypothetical protein EG68_03270 [Paragonimus skrjabini miyazakii]|uniref:PDZ domain-containing protein n=1 Tax=Paragonimus skrjabini miyazakii TaxID=59628 RepID=A0A8S9Z294_9TREM|nr:hypothetical protein EG68_03270 [Paragonimus skrjabini miyazakii]